MYPSYPFLGSEPTAPSYADTIAPPADADADAAHKQFMMRAKARDAMHAMQAEHVCGRCEQLLHGSAADTLASFVFYAACAHVEHLACAAPVLADKPPALLRGGLGSVCARCAKEQVARRDALHGFVPAAHQHRNFRDADELLNNFRNAYRAAHPNAPSYDELRATPATFAEQRALLRASSSSSSSSMLSALAPQKLRIAASSFTRRLKFASENESDAGELAGDELSAALERDQFTEYAITHNVRLSDMLAATPDATILSVYRAGVRDKDALAQLRFDPIVHFTREFRERVPVWQVCDLYALHFDDLVRPTSEGGFGLTVRTLASLDAIKPAEWALLGATVGTLLALGLQRDDMRRMNMKIDQWRRYLLLERAHLQALRITTREQFTQTMAWDADDEWCPLL